jgi:hypothetical protein
MLGPGDMVARNLAVARVMIAASLTATMGEVGGTAEGLLHWAR